MAEAAPSQPIFISYSRINKDFVLRLIADLQRQGIAVWIDKRSLKPGTRNWEQSLRDAISGSRAVLLVASPDSRRSNYVQDELSIAEMYRRPVYPIWAEGIEWMDCIPMGMGKVQFVDMRGDHYTTGLAEIADTLANPDAIPIETPEAVPDFEPRNPFKGLKAFRAEDERDFFGRDTLISDLLQHLDSVCSKSEGRFLAVVGPSGSGKSSVVMAGLLPRLQAGALSGSERWIYLPPMVPGPSPVKSLAMALSRAMPARSIKTIREDLIDPDGLGTLAQSLVSQPQARVAFLVDQFEELFTQTSDEAERQQFIDLLTSAATDPASPLIVLITLRADFYDRPMNYKALLDLIKTHSVLVPPMTLADLREVIEKPADLPDVRLTFDDGLVAELVFEVREQIGALPLLQFTLDQLFQWRNGQRLTFAAYREIGGVKGALAKHAEESFTALPSDEHRRLARALFLRLIEPGATEQDTTRRRAALGELTLADPEQSRMLREVADAFIGARLLTTDQAGDTTTIEVSHEALIREWTRLGGWLHEARDDVRQQQTISADAAAWVRSGKPPTSDALYRGTVLDDAKKWVNHSVPSADELAFLNAAAQAEARQIAREQAAARQVRNLRRTLTLLSLGAVAAVALMIGAAALAASSVNTAATAIAAQTDSNERIQTAAKLAETVAFRAVTAENMAQVAQTQIVQSGQTLTPIPSTLTPIPMTLTAVARQIDFGNRQIESERLAEQANKILLVWGGNAEAAALLGIRALKTAYTARADAILVQALDHSYAQRTFSGYPGAVRSVVFSPDGKLILTNGGNNTAVLWDAETGERVRTFSGHTNYVERVAFSPDGKRVLTGSDDHTAVLWDVQTGQALYTLSKHTNVVSAVAFSPDGKRVLTGSYDETAILWDAETSQILQTFSGHYGVDSVAFSPDGKHILTGNDDNMAVLWDAETGQSLRTFSGHTDTVMSVAFSPDGKRVLTGSNDYTAILWDAETGQSLRTFSGHRDEVWSVAFSPDGSRVLTGSKDRTAILWDAETGQSLRTFSGHNDYVASVAFSPDGSRVLTGSVDKTAILWDAEIGQSLRTFSGHYSVYSVAFSPDGKRVLTGSADRAAVLWDAETGQSLRTFNGHTDTVSAVAFSSDGKRVLTGSADRTAILWDAETGQSLRTFSGHAGPVYTVAFSPDGKRVLTGSADWTAILWDAETGQSLRTFSGHTGYVWGVTFSPDGKRVLTGSADHTAILWDAETGQSLRTFNGHTWIVYSVAFSPDGKHVLTGSGDWTAILWDAETGQSLRTFNGHTWTVNSVAFSPDGKHVLTGSGDRTAILWDTDYRDFIQYACSRMVRDFTDGERTLYGIADHEQTCPQFASTGTPTPIMPPTSTPIPDVTLPVWTPIASPTPSPKFMPTETSTPTVTPTYPGVLLTFTPLATDTPTP